MSFFEARVKETTTSTGTGNLQLLGAPAGYRTFLAAFGAGTTFYYAIWDVIGGSAYEYGLASVDSSSLMTRGGHIINGSAGTSPVVWGAGVKTVLCAIHPEACLNNGIQTFPNNDATPDIRDGNVWLASNSGATTITNFDMEASGQELLISFTNSNTTIQHNASIRLAGGVNFVGTANDILRLINISGIWYELSRSVNA